VAVGMRDGISWQARQVLSEGLGLVRVASRFSLG
jgi:hypothetical protein